MDDLRPPSPTTGLPLGTFGHTLFPRTLALPAEQIGSHVHVIGVSGSGKSRFLAGLFVSLLEQQRSATLIDPHGDLASLILARLVTNGFFRRARAFERLIYLDLPAAARQQRYVPFNVLQQPLAPHSIASNITEAFHRAWPALANGAAPMFDTLVQDGVKVLHSRVAADRALPTDHRQALSRPTAGTGGGPRRGGLLSAAVRPAVVARSGGPGRRCPASRASAHLFPRVKASLGHTENQLDFRRLIDHNRSMIVNLALEDGEARRLLGCLLTVAAEQGALSRASLPPAERRTTHHLFIDEFSEFSAQSEEALARMLSLTRKYGLFLVMAHQTWSQASGRLKGALQNVGLEVAFRLGRFDAEHAARVFGQVDLLTVKHQVEDPNAAERSHPVFFSLPEQWEQWVQAFAGLKAQQAYVRQPTGRVTRIKTLPFPDPPVVAAELAAVADEYLQRYFRPAPMSTDSSEPPTPLRREPVI